MAVIGDSTFIHSGITGIIGHRLQPHQLHRPDPGQLHHRHDRPPAEPHHRQEPPGRTGGGKWIWRPCARPWAFRRVRVVNPNHLKEMDQVLKEELAAEEPSVIITRSPCVMLKEVPKAARPEGGPRQVQRLRPVYAHRLPGPESAGREGGDRQDPMHRLPGVHADVPPGRLDCLILRRIRQAWKL